MVCEATNCKKRESCINYSVNYFKYKNASKLEQCIDWSRHGSYNVSNDKDGHQVTNQTYDCGDNSVTYPMFESIEI